MLALPLLLMLALGADAKKCALPFRARHPSYGGRAPEVLTELMLPMRDGVKLHTIAVSPLFSSKKTWPAVIDRSPYGSFNTELLADLFLLFDFAAVSQDMRGCCQSEGNFTVWHEDTADGTDTVNWILQQPWSNGQVFQIGASADGIAAFELAKTADANVRRALQGQFIIFATAEARRTFFPGAAYRENLIEGWLEGTVPLQADGIISSVRTHEAPGPWWDQVEIKGDEFAQITWPTVQWAGWSDIFLHGHLYSFDGFQKHSDASVKGHHYLVVDPLGHCQDGAKFFPHNLIAGRSLLPVLMGIELFKGNLKPGAVPEGVDHVTFYVMSMKDAAPGEGNYWTTMPDWPTPKVTSWYLHGDLSLSTTKPVAPSAAASPPPASTTYVYDPSDPTPAIGGNNLLRPLQCGPLDQRKVEARDDTVVFTTAPLPDAVAATGPLDAELFVSTAAGVNDTDFAVKLTCVSPDGTSQLVQDGIQRMRWRISPSQTTPEPMEAGTVYKIRVSLWNTSFVFPKGHRIRVVVSSANAPRFEPNPNTGTPLSSDKKTGGAFKVAHNTIHHSAAYPSAMKLPVVPLSALPKKGILEMANKMRGRIMEKLMESGDATEAANAFFGDVMRGIEATSHTPS
jgi:predicted acyl esterase